MKQNTLLKRGTTLSAEAMARNKRMQAFDNIFLSFDSINYANSSSLNLVLKILCFHQHSPIIYITNVINIREILNLYIGEGFFKYQTNYMNAKLTLADLRSLCEYVGFKIKT